MSSQHLVIDARFCGPPTSGNGGYTCGRLAGLLGGTVEVTLRRPPALERPLPLERSGDALALHDGPDLVAEARKVPSLELDIPAPPSFDEATRASAGYAGFAAHFFPTCFVCGPQRAPGDGLRVFPGPTAAARDVVAAPFVPDASLADESGLVRPEFLWAALDCPGYWGAAPAERPTALLGRMTGSVDGSVPAGTRCVVIGFGLGSEGRKLHAGTALFDEGGRLLGHARQVWIRI